MTERSYYQKNVCQNILNQSVQQKKNLNYSGIGADFNFFFFINIFRDTIKLIIEYLIIKIKLKQLISVKINKK